MISAVPITRTCPHRGGAAVDRLRKPIGDRHSVGAVDGNGEGVADLTHPSVAQPADSVDKHCQRNALYRVQVDRRTTRYGVVSGLKHHFTDESPNCRRARSNQCAAMPRDYCIAGEHDDRSTPYLWHLAPPHVTAGGKSHQDAAAACRNDARSPHSSGSSSGCSS